MYVYIPGLLLTNKDFLKADRKVEGICEFFCHSHSEAMEIIAGFKRLYDLTREEYGH